MISKQRLIRTLNEVRQQAVLGILIEPDCGICKNWWNYRDWETDRKSVV